MTVTADSEIWTYTLTYLLTYLLIYYISVPGFSLNGELMMDRMGQEIAFKGIDLSCQYVPAFSLSAGQHARVNFGQVWLFRLIYLIL